MPGRRGIIGAQGSTGSAAGPSPKNDRECPQAAFRSAQAWTAARVWGWD